VVLILYISERDSWSLKYLIFCICQVRVYSGRGSGQVWTKLDKGREQRAGQEVSLAGVGDRLDSTTKDNKC